MYTHGRNLSRSRRNCASVVLGLCAMLALGTIDAAEDHPSPSYYQFAHILSTRFLLDIAQGPDDYRVALVHEQLGDAVLIPLARSDSPVEFLDAHAWFQVVAQYRVMLDPDKRVRIEVKRASIQVPGCPDLGRACVLST